MTSRQRCTLSMLLMQWIRCCHSEPEVGFWEASRRALDGSPRTTGKPERLVKRCRGFDRLR